MDLSRLLAPRSVAVVGATERPAAYGSEALLNLQRFGFAGRTYAVNPGRASVHGVACAPSLADLPEAPDAVGVSLHDITDLYIERLVYFPKERLIYPHIGS